MGNATNNLDSIHESFTADEDKLFDAAGTEEPAAGGEPAIDTGALEQSGKQAGAAEEDQANAEEKQTIVPYNALHEERLLRKETQAELRRTQEQVAQMAERLKLLDKLEAKLGERQSKETQQAEQEAFEADPIGTLKQKTAQLEEKLSVKEQNEQKIAEQNAQLFRLQQEVAGKVREYIKETPDYPDAFQHLMAVRFAEYQAMGIDNPQELTQRFEQYSMQVAVEALKRGKNPGQLVYELAKAQGYKKAAPKTEEGKADSLTAQLDKLEKGNKAAQSVSKGGAPANSKKLTLADIDNMSDTEIDALWDEMQKGGSGDDLGI